MKKLFFRVIPAFFLLFPLLPAGAKINFSGLDLSGDNRLLFKAVSENNPSQSGVFLSRLNDLALRQLTAFPERMDLIENGKTIQVSNAFGVMRIPMGGGLPRQIPGFPSFSGGAPAFGGRAEEMAVSADGRRLLVIEPVSHAYGNLVIIDAVSGEKALAASRIERPGRDFPACWSPDSRVFVYARGGQLYYYTVNSVSGLVDEQFRLIGEGTAASVRWTRGGDFFYLRGSTVYRVRGAELFTRALYADFLEIGTVAGKIPFEFDPNFDRFWIAPDSRSILLSKGGRNIFYYPLDRDDYEGDYEGSLPYLMMPRSVFDVNVLWSPGGIITVLAAAAGDPGVMAWRLDTGGGDFKSLPEVPGFGAALSPDGSRALLWGPGGVILYDYINWRPLVTLSGRPGYFCLWTGNDECVTGDELRIERIQLNRGVVNARSLVCLSSGSEFGFEEGGSGGPVPVLVKNGDRWYSTDGSAPWRERSNPGLRAPSQVSGRYRVYLEPQSMGPYENLPMIRNTASVGTNSLLPGPDLSFASPLLPAAYGDEPADPRGVFSHGNRRGLREVALCFDLYDDAEGLPELLETLRGFGLRVTFFLNGEFIRRHPAAAADIAAAGHETASMFFAPINLSDSRYRIAGDFVGRGLARNEDEFFQATGKELSLLWHAPWYAASADIAAAAAAAGYRTLGRDVDPLDWVSRDDVRRLGITQLSAADIIDRIMEQTLPGSIIPIRLGLLPGGRRDYLFGRINVLLDALVRSGYSVAPVSALIEHSR
jgi:peptidoglycan/xylan/chitin deacetylase (PgdA/CDA1 family)